MKIEMRFWRKPGLVLATVAAPLLLGSCALTPPVVSSMVGPKPDLVPANSGIGYLRVYSETEDVQLGDGVPYHIHTSYAIETPDGRRVEWVRNHVGDMDESSQTVPLTSGTYQVVAESTDYGQLRVPVLIQAGQTTTVHLEGKGSWKPKKSPAGRQDLVRFPDGEIIGWQASIGQ